MKDRSDFTSFNGGRCPLSQGTIFDTLHRDGSISLRRCIDTPGPVFWNHLGTPCDIVGYREVDRG